MTINDFLKESVVFHENVQNSIGMFHLFIFHIIQMTKMNKSKVLRIYWYFKMVDMFNPFGSSFKRNQASENN